MHKLKFNDLKKLITKNNSFTLTIFVNHSIFQSEERLVHLQEEESALLVYLYY